MKGFVPTPTVLVDEMVSKLFAERRPEASSTVLDPGCGDGEFIAGVLRWCAHRGAPIPQIVGVELEPSRAAHAQRRFADRAEVRIMCEDYLALRADPFDFIVGNPPYVSITDLGVDERARYRAEFTTATSRFDLYALFFEQSLRLLAPVGKLVFVTPEKFTYVESARPLREMLASRGVAELHYYREDAFPGYVTYPLITSVVASSRASQTRILRRDGSLAASRLPGASSWMPAVSGFVADSRASSARLGDFTQRISCGVATGADSVFVVPNAMLTAAIEPFAFPTIAGRQLVSGRELSSSSYMLAPYDRSGALLAEGELEGLGDYLRVPERRKRLESRTCALRKPWYAFHDGFPAEEMLRPKIICKDISADPVFVVDHSGSIAPRHSAYYIVPIESSDIGLIADYLDSQTAKAWLRAHCQRAANGFMRLQSHVLRQLPVPKALELQLSGRRDTSDLPLLLPA